MLSKVKRLVQEFNASREYKKYIKILHQEAEGIPADALVDLIQGQKWNRFFWMIQIPSEIKYLLRKVEEQKPKVVVEIGTRMGGTLFLFTKMAQKNAKIISIDYPDGFGGYYKPSRINFYKSFATGNQSMTLIKGDSHAAQTKQQLLQALNGEKIDFLFIDGDHSYEGVKMDFEMYGPLVRGGGLIAFHDNKPTESNAWSGVIPYWEELKKSSYKTEEFFGDEDTWGGMGVLVK
jgi:cephalosporin hydroxylase